MRVYSLPFVKLRYLAVLLFAIYCSLFTLPASAQQDDFGLDFSLEAQKKIDKKWSVSLEGELRTRNNAQTNDRWSVGLGADYKATKWLKASVGYYYLYDNNERISYYEEDDDAVDDGDAEVGDPKKCGRYWQGRHRFNVSLTLSKKLIGDFKFSLRERWQYTYRPEYTVDERWSYLKNAYDGKPHTYSGKGKNVLRSRLQVEYDKSKMPVTPYASVELFNARSLEKIRYQAGVDWSISKLHAVGAFYRYQHVSDEDEAEEPNRHLIGLSYKLKF
ncbi:MAG: DUF2490 domain-containing protein [Prevotella sp.]|nr:DUF2490 domain-containing protein [Prevotella sp.]